MKGTGAKRNVCPGSCVSTGAKFPVAQVESAPMRASIQRLLPIGTKFIKLSFYKQGYLRDGALLRNLRNGHM